MVHIVGLIGDFKLERWVEEGICEVTSHKYRQWYCSRVFDYSDKIEEHPNFTIKLYQYRAKRMKNSSDEIYGKGFNQ
ncbi:PREDICTED: PRUPE_8G205400, partial [Prunus dulcis]